VAGGVAAEDGGVVVVLCAFAVKAKADVTAISANILSPFRFVIGFLLGICNLFDAGCT
jgi:hypothetical protein